MNKYKLEGGKAWWKSKTIGAIGALVLTDLATNPPQTKNEWVASAFKVGIAVAGIFSRVSSREQIR